MKLLVCLLQVLFFCGWLFSQEPVITVTPPPAEDFYSVKEPGACDYLDGGLGTIDFDLDGIRNCDDNCIFDRNKNQRDKDKDGTGDACEWRKRAEDEWEKTGRIQRQTATEPIDLAKLVSRSTDIFLARVRHISLKQHQLGGFGVLEITRRFKGDPVPNVAGFGGGPWVYFPDDGPRELVGVGELLFFLYDGRIRKWEEPRVFSADVLNGKPYTETHYFGYKLADLKFGVFGVSPDRLRQLEQIISSQRK